MSVLTDIKTRGTEDTLITATDNLNSFTDTIQTVLPESKTQICVIHQIRNACQYVFWKDKKQFTTDMKEIFNPPTRQAAEPALNVFATKWEINTPMQSKAGETTGKILRYSSNSFWK